MFCSKYTPTLEISENKSKHISHLGIFDNNKKSYFVFDNFIHVYIMNWDNFCLLGFCLLLCLFLYPNQSFPSPLSPGPRLTPSTPPLLSLFRNRFIGGNFYPHFLYLSTVHLWQKDEPLPLPLESPPYIVSFVFLPHTKFN